MSEKLFTFPSEEIQVDSEKGFFKKTLEAIEPTLKTLSPAYKALSERDRILKDLSLQKEPPTETDEFEAIKMFGSFDEPSLAEKAEQFKYGLIEEGSKSAAALKLGAESFKLGAKLPTPYAPAKIIAGGAAGLIGMGAGYFLTDEAYDYSKKYAKEEFDYDLLPTPIKGDLLTAYREGGGTTGRLLAGYPVAFMLPKGVATRVGNYFDNTRKYARENPVGFFLTEAPAPVIAGAAVTGLSLSAEDYQLSPGKKALVEVGTTAIVPAQLVVRGALTLKNYLVSMLNEQNLSSKEASAANKILDIIENSPENPDKIIRLLEQETGVKSTAAQKTGSYILSALEKKIASMSPKFANESQKNAEDAFKQVNKFIRAFSNLATDRKDPNLIKIASQLRIKTLKDFLEIRISAGEQKAAEAIAKLGEFNTENTTKIGEIIKTSVNESLTDARQLEKKLWLEAYTSAYRKYLSGTPQEYLLFGKEQKIKVDVLKKRPRKMVLDYLDFVSNLSKRQYNEGYKSIRSFMEEELGVTEEMVEKYKAGMLTEGYYDTLKETGKGIIPSKFLPSTEKIKSVDVRELIKIRSDYLDLARKAMSNTIDYGDARFFGRQARSVLEDLSEIDNVAYQEARQYSKNLNDVFSRSYAKDLTGFKTGKEEKIPVELVLSKAFTTGADTNSLRMEQIQNTAKFMLDKEGYSGKAKERLSSINEAYKQIFRLGASKFVDAETGQINTKRLSRFVSDNKVALQKLNILQDFEEIEKTSNALQAMQNKNSSINKRILEQRDFAKAVKYDDSVTPVSLINEIMTSSQPQKRLYDLYLTAKREGPSAVNGLKSLVLDYSFKNASDSKNNLNAYLFYEKFFTKRGNKKISDFDIMRKVGLLSKKEGDGLKKIIVPMMRIQRADAFKGNVENFTDESSALQEFVLRSTGSKVGQAAFGSSLIAQSAGSKYMRNIFEKMPKVLVYQFIQDAMENPKLLATFLKKGKTSSEMTEIARSFHSALQGAGLGYYISSIEEPVEKVKETVEEFIFSPTSAPKKERFKGPPSRGTKVTPTTIKPTSQSSNQSSRQMLQSLFPLDPVLGAGRPPTA